MPAILSTHTGSLPRPDSLIKTMWALSDGVPVDRQALAAAWDTAVAEVVAKQVAAGVAVINDGEMTKPSYATYVAERLSGFDGQSPEQYYFADLVDYPRSREIVSANPGRRKRHAPACTGPIGVKDRQSAVDDMARLMDAARAQGAERVFTSAASPGVVAYFFPNEHYPSYQEYVFAIADAMRFEYEAIAAAGATVQVDCPDLAMGRHSTYWDLGLDDFRELAAINVEAINRATANIPVEQLRMHLCRGNYPGPHHCDMPIGDIIDIVFRARPRTILFEGANPRHAHEWRAFESIDVPDDKILCPGVIEPQSNYIEHPELVAQRIGQWASVVDPERLMAGVDCGFSIHVGMQGIDPDVAWAKLASLAQGCELASHRIFA